MNLNNYVEIVIHTRKKEIEMIDIDFDPNIGLHQVCDIIKADISTKRKESALDAIISSLVDFNYFYQPYYLMLDDFVIEWLIQNRMLLDSLAHLFIKPKYLEQITELLGGCLEAEEKLKYYSNVNEKLLKHKKKMQELF